MNRRVFEDNISDLKDNLLKCIEAFCHGKGLIFDRTSFEEQTSTDVGYLAREAYYFGANMYPDD